MNYLIKLKKGLKYKYRNNSSHMPFYYIPIPGFPCCGYYC